MFSERFWKQRAVYWTLLFAIFTAVTAVSQTQFTPEKSSQIALAPSEMASITGGGDVCRKCVRYESWECDEYLNCATGADCENGFDDCKAQGAVSHTTRCHYPSGRCDGDGLEGGDPQCYEISATIGREVGCFCHDEAEQCGARTLYYVPGTKCTSHWRLTC